MKYLQLIWSFLKPNFFYVLLALLIAFFYWKLNNMWGEYKEWRTLQQETITQVTVMRDRALVEAETARQTLEQIQNNTVRLKELVEQSLLNQAAIQAEVKEQKDVFERHNFDALVKAKPGLIEHLANKATQERMDAFENSLNQ
jgi:hypothetical protein